MVILHPFLLQYSILLFYSRAILEQTKIKSYQKPFKLLMPKKSQAW